VSNKRVKFDKFL